MTTLKDLRKVAKNLGMKGYSKLKKAELEEAMAMHMYNTGMIVNTAYANLSTKSRKPAKKKPAAKKKSRKPAAKKKSRKPVKKKSRKPVAKKKPVKKSRKPAKKSRKPRQSPPSGVIKQENLKPGTVRVGADGKTKYEVYERCRR